MHLPLPTAFVILALHKYCRDNKLDFSDHHKITTQEFVDRMIDDAKDIKADAETKGEYPNLYDCIEDAVKQEMDERLK